VTRDYLFTSRPFTELHQGVRWIAGLATCVFVERAIRLVPSFGPMVVRMFLVGGAAGASFAALRLATVLMEGRVGDSSLAIMTFLLQEVRITALHADPNAAGSYFALVLVPALLIGVRRRSVWLLAVACPLVGLAFLLAQSRAAMLAVGVVVGLTAVIALLRVRRFVAAAVVVVVCAGTGFGASVLTDASHASIDRAAAIRHQMTAVSIEMTRDHPAFGIGVGQYLATSREYISPSYPALHRWAPNGQNAHNNFLQVLAELGVPAFAAFLWLVLPVSRWRWQPASASETAVYASGMAAGLAAFLLSALFGHPLLIVQVASPFFLALGLTAGLLAAPSRPDGIARALTYAAVLTFVVALPWRVAEGRVKPGDMNGLGPVAGVLDGLTYRAAAQHSTWQVPARARGVSLWLRWDAAAASDCDVSVSFDSLEVNRAEPDATVWMPLKFPVPPAQSPDELRELELGVSDPRCRLLVGPLDIQK